MVCCRALSIPGCGEAQFLSPEADNSVISEIRGNYEASCSNHAAQFVCSSVSTRINLMSSYKKLMRAQ